MIFGGRRARGRVGRWGIGLALACGVPVGGAAQEEARPELQGTVTRSGQPFPGAEVVLHRVSAVDAGEIDTVRADPGGRFVFALPTVPRQDQDGDIYFASVRHQGILYFGGAVSRAIQLDSLYAIQAYDTLSAPAEGASLPVSVRYVIAEESPDGWSITDLFEVTHDGEYTWVSAPDGGITWQHPLPPGVRDPEVGGGDASPDAVRVEEGRLTVAGPISPGQRQYVLRYLIDGLDGFEVPLAPGTGTVEFLVREPAPDLEVEGLPGVETIEMQPGVTFRRYAGDAPPEGRFRVQAADPPARWPMEAMAVVLALVLAAAGLYAVRGGASPATAEVEVPSDPFLDPSDERRRILLEIARIDQRLDEMEASDPEHARLASRRAELVARLRTGT